MVLESFAWEWGLCGGVFLHGGLPPSLPSPTTQRPSAMTASRRKGEEGNQGEMQQPNFFFAGIGRLWCRGASTGEAAKATPQSAHRSPPPPSSSAHNTRSSLPSFLPLRKNLGRPLRSHLPRNSRRHMSQSGREPGAAPEPGGGRPGRCQHGGQSNKIAA